MGDTFSNITGNQGIVQIATRGSVIGESPTVQPQAQGGTAEGFGEVGLDRLRVFLCHASEDKPRLASLHKALTLAGCQVWLDSFSLLAGDRWESQIREALKSSHVVIICLSEAANRKDGFVRVEIEIACALAREPATSKISIVPARLEPCELPEPLRDYHAVDLYTAAGMSKLLHALRVRALEHL
jgi:hypothetical protein